MGDVVDLNVGTTLDLSAEKVLEEAKADFEKVVVIGVDKDGSLSIRSSVADGAEILLYLKVGEHTLMDVVMNS